MLQGLGDNFGTPGGTPFVQWADNHALIDVCRGCKILKIPTALRLVKLLMECHRNYPLFSQDLSSSRDPIATNSELLC